MGVTSFIVGKLFVAFRRWITEPPEALHREVISPDEHDKVPILYRGAVTAELRLYWKKMTILARKWQWMLNSVDSRDKPMK